VASANRPPISRISIRRRRPHTHRCGPRPALLPLQPKGGGGPVRSGMIAGVGQDDNPPRLCAAWLWSSAHARHLPSVPDGPADQPRLPLPPRHGRVAMIPARTQWGAPRSRPSSACFRLMTRRTQRKEAARADLSHQENRSAATARQMSPRPCPAGCPAHRRPSPSLHHACAWPVSSST
jgi:hypothetical protein